MPILAAETSIFPDDLLEPSFAEQSGRCWWGIYTRPRQEKALARQLLRYEVPFYLPLVEKENLIRGRRVQTHVPLFGGYLFLLASDQERVQCLTTNRVAQVLGVEQGEQLTDDLRSIQCLIAADAPLTVERRLTVGRRVRVKSGSMMGLEGSVIDERGRSKLIVSVRFLQQSVAVEIDRFQLEPLD